ncbi:hypothetical protein BT96DRAFT_922006, partial [Gymnopus androsaceus JB14]
RIRLRSSKPNPPHRRITQDDAPSMSMALPPAQAGQTDNGKNRGPPFTQPPQPQTLLPGAGAHSKPGTGSGSSGSVTGTGVGAMYVPQGGGSQRKKPRLG